MASGTFNVGIVGYGFSAKVFHIPFIKATPGLKLHALVQRKPTDISDTPSDLLGVEIYRSVSELTADKNVDLVVVSTPPWTHYDIAVSCLKAGKHVLIEKPVTPTSKEADELATLARQCGLMLTVYQNRRWDTDFLTVAQLVSQNALGKVFEFESHFDRYTPGFAATLSRGSKPGVGIEFDLGVHLIDQAYVLFGMPQRVSAFLKQGTDPTTGDYCTILLHYDELLVTIKANTQSAERDQLRFWIRGSKGSYKKHHLDIQESQLQSGTQPGDANFGIENSSRHGTLTRCVGNELQSATYSNVPVKLYSEFYIKLVEALRGSQDVPVDVSECRQVIKIVELARESAKTGKTMLC